VNIKNNNYYNVTTAIIIIIHCVIPLFTEMGVQQTNPVMLLVPDTDTPAFQKGRLRMHPRQRKAQDLTAALLYYIAKDMMPVQIVERPVFLWPVEVAVPHYNVSADN
jgi:hypothetical protein